MDFAYAVHSGVGDTCIGAKVNGRIVPLRSQLKNGDQVDIITAKAQTPSPTWERFVVTGKARSEIRKFVRTQQRTEYVNLGKAILQKSFKQEGHDLKDSMIEPHLKALNKKTVEDVYAEVGEGLINRTQVLELALGIKKTNGVASALKNPFARFRKKGKGAAMPIKGLIPGMALHYAGCCHPIPGDKIVGIVTTGKGITIHTTDCETLENFSDTPERWMDVSWEQADADTDEMPSYVGRLKALISHETAALATLANVIAKDLGNINNLRITNRSTDFFEIIVDVEVKDSQHLNNIIASLRSKDVIQSVERFNN